MQLSTLINVAPSIDWADTIVNQSIEAVEPAERDPKESLMLRLKRTYTALRKDEKQLACLKENGWCEPEHEPLFSARKIRFNNKINLLKADVAYHERTGIIDTIQKVGEWGDLFVQGTNTYVTLGSMAAKAMLLGLYLNSSAGEVNTQERAVDVAKQVAKTGAKLMAKAAFDYLLPTASPFVSYTVLNVGESACSLVADYLSSPSEVNVKKYTFNTALKLAATVGLSLALRPWLPL